ncbi:unnamed protein product, partial [Prorocentrum cordatum]
MGAKSRMLAHVLDFSPLEWRKPVAARAAFACLRNELAANGLLAYLGQTVPGECPAAPQLDCPWSYWLALGIFIGVLAGWTTAVSLMRETTFDDWVMPGPRVAKEWLVSVRDGVSESSAVAHIHYVLCEVVRLAMQTVQLDVANLLSFEFAMRRICRDETAVARNPRHPGYGGLEIALRAPTTEQGPASANKFTEWATGRLKEHAAIYKHTRLWNEEQRALQAARGSGDHRKGKGRGSRRGKGGKGDEEDHDKQ